MIPQIRGSEGQVCCGRINAGWKMRKNLGAQSIASIPSTMTSYGSRLKIAVIGIRGLPPNYGGLETCADEVTRRWAVQGHDILVYCRKNRYSVRPVQIDNVKLVYTSAISTKNLDTISHTLFSIFHLLLFRSQYRNVHLYNTGNSIFIPILKLFNKKVILSGDGIEWKREKWGAIAKFVHRLGEKFAVRFADTIVADNEEVGKYYQSNHNIATALIAYGTNAIQVDPAYSTALLAEHRLVARQYFLFVGRFVPEKGVHDLIEAYKQLRTDYPLVIIGDDSSGSEYRNELFRQQSEMVRLLGFIYAKDYEQLLVNAYMYVSASRLEGTSPSLLAAMGAGVCSLVNGIEENISTAKGAAAVYKENDTMDLVRLWQDFIDDPNKVDDMAKKGQDFVAKHYQWDTIASDYLALMDSN